MKLTSDEKSYIKQRVEANINCVRYLGDETKDTAKRFILASKTAERFSAFLDSIGVHHELFATIDANSSYVYIELDERHGYYSPYNLRLPIFKGKLPESFDLDDALKEAYVRTSYKSEDDRLTVIDNLIANLSEKLIAERKATCDKFLEDVIAGIKKLDSLIK